jgi:hypothetical protein
MDSLTVITVFLHNFLMTTSSLYPTHAISCKVPRSSGAFQTQIQPQRPGRFSNAKQRRVKKADTEYPFEHCEVTKYTSDGVSICPVITMIRASFLTQLPERKETGDFTMRPMVTLKQIQSIIAVIGEN